jgi:hypothetical protein
MWCCHCHRSISFIIDLLSPRRSANVSIIYQYVLCDDVCSIYVQLYPALFYIQCLVAVAYPSAYLLLVRLDVSF